MSRSPVQNATGDSCFPWDGEMRVVNTLGKPSAGKASDPMVRFPVPLFGVAAADIEGVFGQENVNKQLRIRAPRQLPPVFTQPP